MKILVTGSLGFIATNLIRKIAKNGNNFIYGIDSLISGSANEEFTKKICKHNFFDLNEKDKLKDCLNGIDIVIHLAARGNVIESINDPILNFNSNVYSTLNLLECMKEKNVKNLIFSSTGGALIGNCEPPVNENSKPNPISPYGASKMACEGYISAYAESFDIKSVVLRFGNVYGPYSKHKKGVLNKWIISALKNQPIIIYGDGSSSRDYIHVDDLSDGIISAIRFLYSDKSKKNNLFHLANNNETTLNDLTKVLKIINGKDLKIKYLPNRKGEVFRNFADTTRASLNLGFKPLIKLEDGIRDIYNWFKLNLDNEISS